MNKTTKDKVKITIQNRIRLDIEVYFLDTYAQKKYKCAFNDSKEQVNKDLIELTKKHNIKKISDVRFILINELLPDNEKQEILKEYVG